MASAKKTRVKRAQMARSSSRFAEANIALSDIYDDNLGGSNQPHTTERNKQIRMGGKVSLLRSEIIGSKINTSANRWDVMGPSKRILNVTEDDSIQQGLGSWVMTLRGRIKTPGGIIVGATKAVPAVAFIEFGKGGITQRVEVDAWSNVIALPADTLYVDVGYVKFGLGSNNGPEEVFDEVEFSATAHKSLETGEVIPTRSYFLEASGEIPIPPFATSWTIVPTRDQVVSGSQPYTAVVFSDGLANGGSILDFPLDEVVESMSRMFCFRPLPAGAGILQITANTAPVWPAQVIFRIGL